MNQVNNRNSNFKTESAKIGKLLRKEIYSGQRMPNEHLTENKLAQHFSTNRIVVRQVLSELAEDGLVAIEPFKGASVASVSIDQILETFHVVAMLEGYSAKIAADNITKQDLNKLSNIVEKQKEIIRGDPKEWQKLNYQFHRIINLKSGNPQILHLLRKNTQFTNYWFLSKPETDFRVANKAHEKIVQALSHRDGDKARKHMEEHVIVRLDNLIDHIRQRIPVGMFRSR